MSSGSAPLSKLRAPIYCFKANKKEGCFTDKQRSGLFRNYILLCSVFPRSAPWLLFFHSAGSGGHYSRVASINVMVH